MHNERSIQETLAAWCIEKGHSHVIPNCGVFGHEADLISVTESGLAHEYEIKVCRYDFRADAAKRKHKYMLGQAAKWFTGPSYFWYVCPVDLVPYIESDIPEHAGLATIRIVEKGYYKGQYFVQTLKRAPRLHNNPILTKYQEYIQRGLMLRYWKTDTRKDMIDYYNKGFGTGVAVALEKLESLGLDAAVASLEKIIK